MFESSLETVKSTLFSTYTVPVATVLILLVEIIILFFTNKRQKKIFKAQKTMELIEFYMDKILPILRFYKNLFHESEVLANINSLTPNHHVKFDKEELTARFKEIEQAIPEDSHLFYFNNITTVLTESADSHSDKIDSFKSSLKHSFKTDKEECEYLLENKKRLCQFLIYEFTSLMNRYEYFAMCFYSDVTDKDICFQSLHQTYMAAVHIFYIGICMKNDVKLSDKYYCNTIRLYRDWRQKQLQIEKNNNKMLIKIEKREVKSSKQTERRKSKLAKQKEKLVKLKHKI